MTALQPRILVVDDDIQIRRALRQALAARGYDVVLAASGEDAVERAAVDTPDLVILDLGLPGMSGIDVCKELRSWTQIPIVVLSVHDRPQDKVAALDLGADDYLTKPFDTSEMLARLRSQLRRASQAQPLPPVFEYFGLRVDLAGHRVTRDGVDIHLTKTEFSFLEYLIRNANRVVTYGLLVAHVWGSEDQADLPTLRTHVTNLRRKLEGDSDLPRLILTEPGVGYRLVTQPAGS